MGQIRDLDRMRELLIYIKFEDDLPMLLEVDNNHDRYQYYLMRDGGLLEFEIYPIGSNQIRYTNMKITNKGHYFIDNIINEKDYEGLKKIAAKGGRKLVDLPFDLIFKLSQKYLEQQIGL